MPHRLSPDAYQSPKIWRNRSFVHKSLLIIWLENLWYRRYPKKKKILSDLILFVPPIHLLRPVLTIFFTYCTAHIYWNCPFYFCSSSPYDGYFFCVGALSSIRPMNILLPRKKTRTSAGLFKATTSNQWVISINVFFLSSSLSWWTSRRKALYKHLLARASPNWFPTKSIKKGHCQRRQKVSGSLCKFFQESASFPKEDWRSHFRPEKKTTLRKRHWISFTWKIGPTVTDRPSAESIYVFIYIYGCIKGRGRDRWNGHIWKITPHRHGNFFFSPSFSASLFFPLY